MATVSKKMRELRPALKGYCADCLFWDKFAMADDHWGKPVAPCKRFPPTYERQLNGNISAGYGGWLKTRDDDWCAEFVDREKHRKKF